MALKLTDLSYSKQFRASSCLLQVFSLPIPIIKYLWENPSCTRVYQKLINCCKLFFKKNPILIINNSIYFSSTGWHYLKEEGHRFRFMSYEDIFKTCSKIWVTGKLNIDGDFCSSFSTAASNFIQKIDRYNVEQLFLVNQRLFYNELVFLSSSVKECSFNNVRIKYQNEEFVLLENVVNIFLNAKTISITFSFNYQNAACNSYDALINVLHQMKKIKLNYIPRIFDVSQFYQHLKKSKSRVFFYRNSCDAVYQINKVIDEILTTKLFDFTPPVIEYRGIDKQVSDKMRNLQQKEAEKYC